MNQAAASFGSTRQIIPAGTQLNGIYEIDLPIAAGGMGEIYKGHAIQTGDLVAIKLIRSDLAEAEAAFALFRKEASALHNLYHEAIVRYYVFTIDPVLERPYLAMEFVDGLSLSAMLRGGPLAVEAVQRLMQRIAAGLHAAHERGIIHRDVSPDNIIIPSGDMGQAKIIDFGIARSTRLGEEGTIIGSGFAGKYNYVSPEQLGLFGGEITPKSDIYSLGLVLAEALLAKPIDMGGNHVDVIDKRRQVPDLGAIDKRLRPLIEKMLQPNPDDRPASMAEVAAWSIDETTTLWPPARQKTTRTTKLEPQPAGGGGLRPVLFGGIAAALAGMIAAGVYLVLRPPQPVEVPPAPPLQSALGPTLTPEDTAQKKPTPTLDAPTLNSPGDGAKPDAGKTTNPSGGQTGAGNQVAGLIKPGLAPPSEIRPLPPAVLPRDITRHIDEVTRYIRQYEGGDCFFVKPVAVNEMVTAIEGFGASETPFQVLNDAFRKTNGYEADIGLRQVDRRQCPAVNFLQHMRSASASAPTIDLDTASLKVGQNLSGTIKGVDGRRIDLLVVAEDGSLRTIETTPSRDNDGTLTFSQKIGPELGNGQLQMVLAIASSKPLNVLRNARGTPAEKLFPVVQAEADRTNQTLSASARTFKVES